MNNNIRALLIGVITAAAPFTGFAFNVEEYKDKFEDFTIRELTDNHIYGLGQDKYSIYLNFQERRNTTGTAYAFVVVYFSPTVEFNIGDSIFFLADEEKIKLERLTKGYTKNGQNLLRSCRAAYKIQWGNYVLSLEYSNPIRSKEYKRKIEEAHRYYRSLDYATYYEEVGLFGISIEDVNKITDARKVEFKIQGLAGKDIIGELSVDNADNLRRFLGHESEIQIKASQGRDTVINNTHDNKP